MSTASSDSAHSLPIFQKELVMADANLSADKIRAMLAEANGRLRTASAEYFDLLEKGLSSSPLPVADAEGGRRPAEALEAFCRPDQAWDGYGASIPGRRRRQRDQHHDPPSARGYT
jgi:hypothetical protein